MTLSLLAHNQMDMKFFNGRFSVLMLVMGCGFASVSLAQTPDWMFALEGTYVGRMETMEGALKATTDVRLDGLRNGSEDGFVLQFAISTEFGIRERVEMWGWDKELDQVLMTTLEDNKPLVSKWFVDQSGAQVVLSCGGSEAGRAVLIQWRITRLPGQLRMDRLINDGSGRWELLDRYVLDEGEPED